MGKYWIWFLWNVFILLLFLKDILMSSENSTLTALFFSTLEIFHQLLDQLLRASIHVMTLKLICLLSLAAFKFLLCLCWLLSIWWVFKNMFYIIFLFCLEFIWLLELEIHVFHQFSIYILAIIFSNIISDSFSHSGTHLHGYKTCLWFIFYVIIF